MRVTQIRTPTDLGWFTLDQVLHGVIGYLPVFWFVDDLGQVAAAAATIMLIREGEQGRRTVKEWRNTRRLSGQKFNGEPLTWRDKIISLHLPDRVSDVVGGVLFAMAYDTTARLLGWL